MTSGSRARAAEKPAASAEANIERQSLPCSDGSRVKTDCFHLRLQMASNPSAEEDATRSIHLADPQLH